MKPTCIENYEKNVILLKGFLDTLEFSLPYEQHNTRNVFETINHVVKILFDDEQPRKLTKQQDKIMKRIVKYYALLNLNK